MNCVHYDAAQCTSCTLLPLAYPAQVANKLANCRELVNPFLTPNLPANSLWLPPALSATAGFRNKAKLAVGGTATHPTLGILDTHYQGIDLEHCLLYPGAISATFPILKEFIGLAQLVPYDVPTRRGELKFVLITANAAGELMIRFVLRSTEALLRIRKHLPTLQAQLPNLLIATVNLQPLPKATVEGEEEIVLTATDTLPMPVGDVVLGLRPQSFFQTNTAVAGELYRQVRQWCLESPGELWDLYCGVGGFALHAALDSPFPITGIEISPQAIASAQATANSQATASKVAATASLNFIADDAATYLRAAPHLPDVVIVNPPRRGIGTDLATFLNDSSVETIIYSSCNPRSLAKDLAAMPGFYVSAARMFDMFPHTDHVEVAVKLVRSTQR